MEGSLEKKIDKKKKALRPFGIEYLEVVPDAELAKSTGGKFHTMHVSIHPRPDHG
jgi:hypothetical protein